MDVMDPRTSAEMTLLCPRCHESKHGLTTSCTNYYVINRLFFQSEFLSVKPGKAPIVAPIIAPIVAEPPIIAPAIAAGPPIVAPIVAGPPVAPIVAGPQIVAPIVANSAAGLGNVISRFADSHSSLCIAAV